MVSTMRAPSARASEAPTARANRFVVWILLALGLLLMLVSAGRAETLSSSTRVERFHGTLASGQTIQVENVSGEIVASRGREFSALVTITASAPSKAKADQLLSGTRIRTSHDEDGWSLETQLPGMRHGGDWHRGADCRSCRVVARYEIVVPPGVTAELQTVNGDVHVRDLDGDLQLETVNGSIDARGVRRALEAQTVNGKIEAVVQALPADGRVELQTVNGAITLTLPKDAKFDFSGETMNGMIASTFPFRAPLPEAIERSAPKNRGERKRKIVVKDDQGDETVVDLGELEDDLADSMKDVEAGMREAEKGLREAERTMRTIRVLDPRREYTGSIGNGGADVRISTLNGTVLVLAAGTSEADAKPLVVERNQFIVTLGPDHVRIPAPPVPPVPPVAPKHPRPPAPLGEDEEGEVVRGDVNGDFLSTTSDNSYRIGRVSGRVQILTHSGEIRVGGIGAGGDLRTYGGDIILGPVTGELKATTMAGDIRSESVSGSVLAETAGGDIRILRVGGGLEAKTSGGDIIVPSVGGSVRAFTAGGDVRIGVLSRDLKGGIVIRNQGGDVSLTLPADCKADVELSVTGADEDESAIRSEFSDVTISKSPGSVRATAKLNGGGEKVVVRTTSGTIRLKKAV